MIWTLPTGDDAYDRRWSAIKAGFTRQWLDAGGSEAGRSSASQRKRTRGVWQPRYLEHTIRDEQDLEDHVNYIHYNPVKHGYVDHPGDWQWSSLHRYVKQGILDADWGTGGVKTSRCDEDLLE